jgi:hypothetical protein
MTAVAWTLVACAVTPPGTDPPSRPPLDGVDVVGDPDITLVGEVFLDLAWPSEHRDGCLSIDDGSGHVEIVSDESWTVARDDATGWFDVTDEAGTIVGREHRLVRVRGDFLNRPGCREGRLFRVDEISPLVPAGEATLRIEVTYHPDLVFVEGSVNVVRVLAAGQPLFQEPVEPGRSVAIPAGPIRVIDFQKPCSGNCQQAYGSELPCSIPLDLEPGEVATVSLALTTEGCTSEVRTESAAAGRHASSTSVGP